MRSTDKYRVPAERICWHCNTSELKFECTDELAPPRGLIGQDRALRAMEFGLQVNKRGYNLFVTGLTGTGRAAAIKRHLETMVDEQQVDGTKALIHDWCYVHNFADPDRPRVLSMAPGQGRRLSRRGEELLTSLREEIPKVFSAEEYVAERKLLEEKGRVGYQKELSALDREVSAENFGLQFSPAGANLFPLTLEGKPFPPEEFMALGEEERHAIEDKRAKLLQLVQETMERVRDIEKATIDRIKELDGRVGGLRVWGIFRDILAEYQDLPEVSATWSPSRSTA